jgi:WD40 repeat protein
MDITAYRHARVHSSKLALPPDIERPLIAAISPDASILATAGDTQHVWLRFADAWRPRELPNAGWASAVAFSPTGTVVAFGCAVRERGPNVLLSAEDQGYTIGPSGIVHRDGDIAYIDGRPAEVRDITTEVEGPLHTWAVIELRVIPGGQVSQNLRDIRFRDPIRAIAFSHDGRLAAGTDSGALGIWSIETGAFIQSSYLPYDRRAGVYSLSFSPDGRYLSAGGYDGQVWLWDLTSWQMEAVPNLKKGGLASIAFSGSNQLCAIGNGRGLVICDMANQWQERGLPEEYNSTVQTVAFSPDGNLVAAAQPLENRILLWDTSSGEIASLPGGLPSPTSVAFSTSGATLAAWNADGEVALFETGLTADGPTAAYEFERAIEASEKAKAAQQQRERSEAEQRKRSTPTW